MAITESERMRGEEDDVHQQIVEELQAENERLQQQLDDAKQGVELAESEIAGRDQQIERLQAEIDELKKAARPARPSRPQDLDTSG